MSFCIFNQQRHWADGTQNTATSPMLQRCAQLLHQNLNDMGLFDRVFSSSASQQSNEKKYTPLNDYEAWVGVLFACASADGNVSDIEIDTLSKLLVYKQKFSNIEIAPFYKIAIQIKSELGSQKLIEGCAAVIKPEDQPTVFAMATEIVLADGVLGEQEKSLLESLAELFELENDLASKIIEVLLIKNKGNTIVAD